MTDVGDRIDRQAVAAIVAMALAVFVIANDFTAMSVALPAIETAFDSDVSTVQWVVSGYALLFGVLIVPGGRLADMFGRTRILYVGAAIFAGCSLVGGLAPDVGVLVAARMAQGIGAAMMWPAILGLIYAILPESKAGLAGGLVIGVAGIGNAVGPLLGGFLTQAASWRWLLLINVPIAGIACLVTWRTVHLSAPPDRQAIDGVGVALLSVSLGALLYALGQAPDVGWGAPLVLVLLALSAAGLVAFGVWQRRRGDGALVPPAVVANRPFLAACLATLMMSSTFFATLLYLPQYFQKILDQGPLASGASLLPFMAVFAAASFSETWLLNRIGMKAVVTVGAACMAAGPILFVALLHDGATVATLVPGMLVLGVGVGLFYSSVTTAGLTALDPSQSSLAGGILYMFQIAGGAIGLGLTTTIFLIVANGAIADGAVRVGVTLTADEVAAARGVVAGTDSSATVLAAHPGVPGEQIVDVVSDAFVAGMRWAFAFDLTLALIGFAIAALRVGGPLRRFGRDVHDPPTAAAPTDG